MITNRHRSVLNVVLFFSVIGVNYLANILPINGVTQREISADYQIYMTPAGYVFSIWGFIYLGLSFFIVAQALPRWVDDTRIRSLDLPFAVSCICNMTWLVVWHHRNVGLSVLLMLGLLGSLIWIYRRLDEGRLLTEKSGWFVEQTFSAYLGWVSLATILNVAIWLYSLGWRGGPISPQGWTAVMLGVALTLYLYLGLSRRDYVVLGVLSWASLGIWVKHQEDSVVAIASLVVCTIALLALIRILVTSPGATSPIQDGKR